MALFRMKLDAENVIVLNCGIKGITMFRFQDGIFFRVPVTDMAS